MSIQNNRMHGESKATLRILALPYLDIKELNPYQALLYQDIRPEHAKIYRFTARRLATGRWNIWHFHWPESILCGLPRRAKHRAVYRVFKYCVLLKIARWRGIQVVWTVHNLKPHESTFPLLERAWLAFFSRSISGIICLSGSVEKKLLDQLPATRTKRRYIVPHGHYRGWYPDFLSADRARHRLGLAKCTNVALFLGMIRPYKNVRQLIECFAATSASNWSLLVAGMPYLNTTREEIRSAAKGHSNIILDLNFVEHENIQLYLRPAKLFVVPYTDVLNSGSAILALSFDCPVLVPNKGAMADLQKTVGRDWIMTYEGDLTEDILNAAFSWASASRTTRAPLDNLDWSVIADLTVEAFRDISFAGTGFLRRLDKATRNKVSHSNPSSHTP